MAAVRHIAPEQVLEPFIGRVVRGMVVWASLGTMSDLHDGAIAAFYVEPFQRDARPMQNPDLTSPPFTWDACAAPDAVAASMVDCFHALRDRPDRLAWSFAAAVAAAGGDRAHPLCRAGLTIAADIDRGIGAGIPGGYHTPQHLVEVVLSALYLCGRTGIVGDRALGVLTAALIHDFHYDGVLGGPNAFRLEAIAVREAMPYLQAAGVDTAVQQRLARLVLATEPTTGAPFARACHAFHRGSAAAPTTPAPMPELDALRDDAALALEATLLVEADALPSIGLTIEHANHVQSLLAAEWRRPLGAEDKLQFIDEIFVDFLVGDFFSPNMRALRDDCLDRIQGRLHGPA